MIHESLEVKMSPREIMLGRKINYTKEYDLGFGYYFILYNTEVVGKTIDNRALDAIQSHERCLGVLRY